MNRHRQPEIHNHAPRPVDRHPVDQQLSDLPPALRVEPWQLPRRLAGPCLHSVDAALGLDRCGALALDVREPFPQSGQPVGLPSEQPVKAGPAQSGSS